MATGYITRRDKRILAFVDRYRAVTEELLTLAFFRGENLKTSAARVVRRMVRRGLLQRQQYAVGQSFVMLTRRGCRVVGTKVRAPKPMSEQSLPAALAIASHCVRHGLQRITNQEFRGRYPELWKPGLQSSNYYLKKDAAGHTLGLFLVDRGGTARRIRSKVRRLITQRHSLPRFGTLIEAKRFRVTVLTGSDVQRGLIRKSVEQNDFWGVEVDVAVVPELGGFLTMR